jgi:hypothetical protein
MALDPPAPLAVVGQSDEHADGVQLCVADRAGAALLDAEDLLQAHDRRRLEHALRRELGVEQAEGERPLLGLQGLDRDALPLAGNPVPVEPFGPLEGKVASAFCAGSSDATNRRVASAIIEAVSSAPDAGKPDVYEISKARTGVIRLIVVSDGSSGYLIHPGGAIRRRLSGQVPGSNVAPCGLARHLSGRPSRRSGAGPASPRRRPSARRPYRPCPSSTPP